jgi:ubiquinone/menaquinone biosynthesis C-methylase UbiE
MRPRVVQQDKQREVQFFDDHAAADEYNVFSDATNRRLLRACLDAAGMRPPEAIADLGCGSGVFTSLLAKAGFTATGVDLSPRMIELARKLHPGSTFLEGDVESLPFEDETFDDVLLSGILHHLPDPTACIREVRRILKPGGRFASFDPNRLNPFMYLYRDRSSPFYSPKGVTPNERPVLAKELVRLFRAQSFDVHAEYLSNLHYRYVASATMRRLLPLYNWFDTIAFALPVTRPLRAFVILAGTKA